MPRPRRKPAPPGRVEIVCTGRGDPGHGRKHLAVLQMTRDGDSITFGWVPHGRDGHVPVTGYRHGDDGLHTIEARCGRCRRHLKRREEDFARITAALAQHQGNDGGRPVIIDISLIERAI